MVVGEDGDIMVELATQPTYHVGDDGDVGLGMAAVGQHVKDHLELGAIFLNRAIFLDGEMSLEEAVELLERLDRLLVAVGEK